MIWDFKQHFPLPLEVVRWLGRGWKPVYQPHFWTAVTGRIQKVYHDAQKRLVLIAHSLTHTHTHTSPRSDTAIYSFTHTHTPPRSHCCMHAHTHAHTHTPPRSHCCMLRPREPPVRPLLARLAWGLNRTGTCHALGCYRVALIWLSRWEKSTVVWLMGSQKS